MSEGIGVFLIVLFVVIGLVFWIGVIYALFALARYLTSKSKSGKRGGGKEIFPLPQINL